MKKINLKKIISNQKLDFKKTSIQLFPSNKYPELALRRVIKGEAFLDSNQISRLSLITGLPVGLLYDDGWVKSIKKNIVYFKLGDYSAQLDTSKNITKVFHNKSMFHEEILHSSTVSLSEYLSKINEIVIKYKNRNENN